MVGAEEIGVATTDETAGVMVESRGDNMDGTTTEA